MKFSLSDTLFYSQNWVSSGKFNAIFPLVTHVWAEKCVSSGKFAVSKNKTWVTIGKCHSGYVTKSHWHTLSDTFSFSDTTFQSQKMCHLGYVYCKWNYWRLFVSVKNKIIIYLHCRAGHNIFDITKTLSIFTSHKTSNRNFSNPNVMYTWVFS